MWAPALFPRDPNSTVLLEPESEYNSAATAERPGEHYVLGGLLVMGEPSIGQVTRTALFCKWF